MVLPVNPYVAGNPVGDSPAFVGRVDVQRETLRVLRHPQANVVVLYGQRRVGKTSILQHLAARLPQEGPYRPVYFDLQDKASWPLAQVLQDLARSVAHAQGQADPDLGTDPEISFREQWLPTMLDSLQEGCSLVLLFDEFDVLADPEKGQAAAALFPYLRDLLATDIGRLQFIFVIGRNIGDLDTIALSLFKGAPSWRVSLLNHQDTAELARLSEVGGTLHWSDEAVERVWQLTCGHPFLSQQLCSYVWEQAYDQEPEEPPTVIPENVDAAVPDTLEASGHAMEWLWDGLPPPERVVASALAEAGPTPITPEALERVLHESGVRVVIRELQNAPQLLQEWDLLEPADGGYLFRVELLRRWIVEHKPLSRVQEELDYIEPVAENLYQAALGAYQSGQLDQALGWLRQAVGLNPNHVRANQLLADILLAQDQPGEAAELLERLYAYQPGAARGRLVQALLALTPAADSDGEKLTLYERVLELDPTRVEAIDERRRIWRQHGDVALEAGDLEAALEAYRQVGLSDKAAEVEREIRKRELASRKQTLVELEQAGRYQEALDLARELADAYPEQDWSADLERMGNKARLPELYQRALEALQDGDREAARALLSQVVNLEPEYAKGEAADYLRMAVTGALESRKPAGKPSRKVLGRVLGGAAVVAVLIVAIVIVRPILFPSSTLPVLIGTPFPRRAGTITSENAAQMVQLARWDVEKVNHAAYASGGKLLAVATPLGVCIYGVETLEEMRCIDTDVSPSRVAFSPDGEILATGGEDGTVRLRRVSDGKLLRSLQGHTSNVWTLAFSHDGETLASGAGDTTVRLWRVSDGQLLHTLEHGGGVNSVAFSPDGETLASGSIDNAARLWRVSDGRLLHTLWHEGVVYSVAFSPDGETLASGSGDNTAQLWQVSDGTPLRTIEGLGAVWGVAFSPDGETLALGVEDGIIQLWRVADGTSLSTLEGHTGAVWSVAFSPDGETLASVGHGGTLRLWEVSDGVLLHTLGYTDLQSVAFSPDGRTLALKFFDWTVQLRRVADGTLLNTLQGYSGATRALAFSPDGETLALGAYDNTVRLWRLTDGTSQYLGGHHAGEVTSVAFSPDGETLASGSEDWTVRLWRVPDGTHLRTLEGHTGVVWSVAFSPDGETLASGADDNTVRLWRLTDGTSLDLPGHTAGVTSVAFSPDGEMLASGSDDGTVRLWQVADNKYLYSLQHEAVVHSVAFSPDGETLASGAKDGTVRLWRVSDGTLLHTLEGHKDAVLGVTFSPEGDMLVSNGDAGDRTVRFWGIPAE